jgi:hypothetical protein
MIGEAGRAPFQFPLEFGLQRRKITENLSQVSRLVSDNSRFVDLAVCGYLGTTSTGLQSVSPPRLPVGDFSLLLVGTSAFQVTELRASKHRITSCQSSDVVGKIGILIFSCIGVLVTY